jgi:hypothetical protein
MKGRLLYKPQDMKKAFKREFRGRKWETAGRTNYYVADDAQTNKGPLKLPFKEQREYLKARGKPKIDTYNSAVFKKGRVSVKVQFGIYWFVQFDLFVNHKADSVHDRIVLGIDIIPTKVLKQHMSSGPPYFENHSHEIVRQGRTFPPVPLIPFGVEP